MRLLMAHYVQSPATPWASVSELSHSVTRWRRLYRPGCHMRSGSKHFPGHTVGVWLWLRPVSWLQSPWLCSLGSAASLPRLLTYKAVHTVLFPVILSWLVSTHPYNAVNLFINSVHICSLRYNHPLLEKRETSREPVQVIFFYCSGNQSPKRVNSFHRSETWVTVLPGSRTPASPQPTFLWPNSCYLLLVNYFPNWASLSPLPFSCFVSANYKFLETEETFYIIKL